MAPAHIAGLEARCAEHGVAARRAGEVTAERAVVFDGLFALDLDELAERHERALPEALGLR